MDNSKTPATTHGKKRMGRSRKKKVGPGRPVKENKATGAERMRLSRQHKRAQNLSVSSVQGEPEPTEPPQVIKMGRPLKPNKMTPAERKRKSRQNAAVREKEKAAKNDKEDEMKKTEEGYEELREKWATKKQGQRERQGKQKRYAVRQKDNARKQREKAEEQKTPPTTSTERMRKHRTSLKVTCDFIKKKRKPVSTPLRKSKERMNKTLAGNSREDKIDFIKSIIGSQSPGVKRDLNQQSPTPTATPTQSMTPLKETYTLLKKKRDPVNNCVKRALISTLDDNCSKRKLRKHGISYTTFKKVKGGNLEELLKHNKHQKMSTRPPKITKEVKEKILDFYERDDISRVLPYKNKVLKIKNKNGEIEKVPIRVMEYSLLKAFNKFCEVHPEIKVDRRSFEKQRPRYVKLKRCQQRLVCACSYHLNVDYLRGPLVRLLKLNDVNADMLKSNESMCDYLLCQKAITCILGLCDVCKNFDKLKDFFTENLKCSTDCNKKGVNCVQLGHTIKVCQFEKTVYPHRGKEKKKITLVDKYLTFDDFHTLFMKQMKDFPRHRFSVQHLKEVYDDAVAYVREGVILKVMDFSQNYTCLLRDEIMSLHWVQNTVVVYPVVVLRLDQAGNTREDHFVFYSDDKKKDPWFIELCNLKIIEFYAAKGIDIELDIEFTDGCGHQFKSKEAFRLFVERLKRSVRVYFETAHGKSKSDGLGGVVKSYCLAAVVSGDAVIRNCQELLKFSTEALTQVNRDVGLGPMENHHFYEITEEEIQLYRENHPIKEYYPLPQTLKIHQVSNEIKRTNGIYTKQFACCCSACLDGTPDSCKHRLITGTFSENLSVIRPKWTPFKEKGVGRGGVAQNDDNDEDTDEDDRDEFIDIDEEVYEEGEAYALLQEGDMAVIQSGDPHHPYYLLRLISMPFETESDVTDDYGHTFPSHHRVINGHYLEHFKEAKDGEVLYLDTKMTAYVSSLCVVGVCPALQEITQKRKRKEETMFLVNDDIHQALVELVLA